MPEGLNDVLRELTKVTKTVTADALEGAHGVGKDLLERAKENCPVATGNLRSSGYVHVLGYEVTIGFDAPYAAAVHENLSSNHTSGQAKFLEAPFKALDLPQEVARKVQI
jgi:hypothetical protein